MTLLTCAAVRRRLPAFHDRELPIPELIAIESHVSDCPPCSSELKEMREVGDALRCAAAPGPADDWTGLQSGVISRMRAEAHESWPARTRRMFDDMHLVWIGFASAVGAFCMKALAPPILRRFGFRQTLLVNTFFGAICIALPAIFSTATPVAAMFAALLASGFFRSLQFTAVSALSFADIPQDKMSRATTMTSVCQQIALSLGISLGAMSLEATIHITGQPLGPDSFWPAFLLIATIAMTSIFPLIKLKPGAGREMSGHRPLAPDPVTIMRER